MSSDVVRDLRAADGLRPEFDALVVTRGLIVFGLAAFAVGGAIVSVIVERPAMSMGAWLTLSVAAAMLAAGILLRTHPVGVWLALIVLTLPIGMSIAEGYPQDSWIAIGIAAFEIVLLLIAMAGRRTGLVIAAVSIVLVGLGSLSSPLSVDLAGEARWVGWIIVPQLAVTVLWMWWAWWDLVRSADRVDEDLARRRDDLEQAQADRERVRVWRRAAARTHETILNDVRYVLRSQTLDRQRLAAHLAATRATDREPDIPADLADLLALVTGDASLGIPVRTVRVEGGAILDPEQWRLVRSAVIEIIRNADRHGRATQVTMSTWSIGRTWFVTIDHDAGAPDASSAPGIGRSIVLDEALADGGIDVHFARGRATLSGELRRPAVHAPEFVAREGSRVILSSVIAASAVGGALYWGVPLIMGGASNIALTLIGLVTAAAAGVIALRSRLIPSWLVLLLGALCGVVPWLVATSTGPCMDLGMTVSVVFLSGYSLTAVLLWARHQWTWVIATLWLGGLLMLVNGSLTTCQAPTLALATTGVIIIPAYLFVAAIGRATATVRWRRARATRERQIIARARAQAEADLALQLERRVDQARALLVEVAHGREVDQSLRDQLSCLDAGIRAAIQVDPVTAGAFTLTARDLAITASDRGIPVVVRALRDSSDPRPLPGEVVQIVQEVLLMSQQPTLQVVTDGRADYLTVQSTASAVTRAGLALDEPVDRDGVLMEAMVVGEEADPSGRENERDASDLECLVMVTRRIARPDASAEQEPASVRREGERQPSAPSRRPPGSAFRV